PVAQHPTRQLDRFECHRPRDVDREPGGLHLRVVDHPFGRPRQYSAHDVAAHGLTPPTLGARARREDIAVARKEGRPVVRSATAGYGNRLGQRGSPPGSVVRQANESPTVSPPTLPGAGRRSRRRRRERETWFLGSAPATVTALG